jgi:hypothetical protein
MMMRGLTGRVFEPRQGFREQKVAAPGQLKIEFRDGFGLLRARKVSTGVVTVPDIAIHVDL